MIKRYLRDLEDPKMLLLALAVNLVIWGIAFAELTWH
jgi:hypothetical protein